jgi:hypothetical protein
MESTIATHTDPQKWVGKTRDTLSNVASRAEGWDTQLRDFTREKPLAALLCALGAGYVLARISTWR